MYVSSSIIIFAFLQFANSVPIDTRSAKNGDHRQKRSSAIVEFLMGSESRQQLLHDQTSLRDVINHNEDDMNANLVCPEKVSNDPNGHVNELSTCPWYYSVSHDPTRFPATVINAERLCEYAVGSNKTFECAPITQKIKVLRQKPNLRDRSKYIWVEEEMTTVIGFTASGRRIADAVDQPSTTPSNLPTPEWDRR